MTNATIPSSPEGIETDSNTSKVFDNMYDIAQRYAISTETLIKDKDFHSAEQGHKFKIVYKGNLSIPEDELEEASEVLREYDSSFQEVFAELNGNCTSIIRIGAKKRERGVYESPINNLISIGPLGQPALTYRRSSTGVSIEIDESRPSQPEIFASDVFEQALIVTPFFYMEELILRDGTTKTQKVHLVVILNHKIGYSELSVIDLDEWRNDPDYENLRLSPEEFKERFETEVDN